jgi:hypothetical protein
LKLVLHNAGVAAFLGEQVLDTSTTTRRLSEVESELAAIDARILQIQDAERALAAKVEEERQRVETVRRDAVAKDARAAGVRTLEAFGQLERANTELLELLHRADGVRGLPNGIPLDLLAMIRGVLAYS